MSTLFYVSGAPGSGKSTLMAALTERCRRIPAVEVEWADAEMSGQLCEILENPDRGQVGVELGSRREAFSGTDALSMSIHPVAMNWIGRAPYDLVLGEGDRLANMAFLRAAVEAGRDVWLVNLEADAQLLNDRCAQRDSRQNASWRAGRATKAMRLAAYWEFHHPEQLISLDARRPTAELVDELHERLPALAVLR